MFGEILYKLSKVLKRERDAELDRVKAQLVQAKLAIKNRETALQLIQNDFTSLWGDHQELQQQYKHLQAARMRDYSLNLPEQEFVAREARR